ncbi:hypothetical protein [Edaphobacter aggregans]|uniref:hypothetical protein n=1 Tax=Edaphobacter aggregans TaxID=570835 RepID=UPI0012FC351B|nr:hypothetical protein [Edaphobacter aggregans]
MSLRKGLLFAMLFAIVALAEPGRVNVYKAEFDVPKPNTLLRALRLPLRHCLGTAAGRQTSQVDGSRHSAGKANCCRRHFFRFNSRTPKI